MRSRQAHTQSQPDTLIYAVNLAVVPDASAKLRLGEFALVHIEIILSLALDTACLIIAGMI